MLLENYFDFLANDDIRLKGTRIGEVYITDWLEWGKKMRAEQKL